jgi:hypothetical protein
MHQGIVQKNGFVDTSQFIDDHHLTQLSEADDSFHLDNYDPGNFEWWYFDITDPDTDTILKIVIHLGTDPLRQKFYPQIALSLHTPAVKTSFIQPCQLNELTASSDTCHLKIADKLFCQVNDDNYYIRIDIPDFKGEFNFQSLLPAWKPLGKKLLFEKKKRSATFGWLIPIPRARVSGIYELNGQKYELNNAEGYHDHNFWKVNRSNKLYIDSVLSAWYWGRFHVADHTIIFMSTTFRQNQIRSLYISDGKQLIHSSNNLIQFHIEQHKVDDRHKYTYPSKMTLSPWHKPDKFNLTLIPKEMIDYKDLLSEVNPLIAFLIRTFVSKPYYLSLKTDCLLTYDRQSIQGSGIIEKMVFRF